MASFDIHHLNRTTCMDLQPTMDHNCRIVLIEWLFEVWDDIKLPLEVIFTTIYILDITLAKKEVSRSKLQLWGICAMWTSIKFHCNKLPSTEIMVSYTDNSFSKQQLIHAEILMLNLLEFGISVPTSAEYWGHIALDNCSVKYFSLLLLAVCEFDLKSYNHRPSAIAHAAVLTAELIQLSGNTSSIHATIEKAKVRLYTSHHVIKWENVVSATLLVHQLWMKYRSHKWVPTLQSIFANNINSKCGHMHADIGFIHEPHQFAILAEYMTHQDDNPGIQLTCKTMLPPSSPPEYMLPTRNRKRQKNQ